MLLQRIFPLFLLRSFLSHFSLSVEKRFSLFELSFKLLPLFLKTQTGMRLTFFILKSGFDYIQNFVKFVDLGSWSVC